MKLIRKLMQSLSTSVPVSATDSSLEVYGEFQEIGGTGLAFQFAEFEGTSFEFERRYLNDPAWKTIAGDDSEKRTWANDNTLEIYVFDYGQVTMNQAQTQYSYQAECRRVIAQRSITSVRHKACAA